VDQESAKLIQLLFSRADEMPYLGVVLGISLTAALMLIATLLQFLSPKKKPLTIATEEQEVVSPKESKPESKEPPKEEKAA